MKTASRVYTALIFVFLFAPIAILLVFSFNEAKSLSVFSGFSLKWYRELLHDQPTLDSVRNTLLLAVSAMVISTVMGTAASVGIDRLRLRWLRAALNTVTDGYLGQGYHLVTIVSCIKIIDIDDAHGLAIDGIPSE